MNSSWEKYAIKKGDWDRVTVALDLLHPDARWAGPENALERLTDWNPWSEPSPDHDQSDHWQHTQFPVPPSAAVVLSLDARQRYNWGFLGTMTVAFGTPEEYEKGGRTKLVLPEELLRMRPPAELDF
jgi:hypothetical protein